MTTSTADPVITVAVLDPGGGKETAAVISSERALRLVEIASDPAGLLDELARRPASVVVVDTRALTPDALLALIGRLRETTAVAVLGDPTEAALLSRAVRAGARSLPVRPYGP